MVVFQDCGFFVPSSFKIIDVRNSANKKISHMMVFLLISNFINGLHLHQFLETKITEKQKD